MLAGTINPGQLVIVREILRQRRLQLRHRGVLRRPGGLHDHQRRQTATALRDDIVTVIDNVAGRDGIDRLVNIERLQFADLAQVAGAGPQRRAGWALTPRSAARAAGRARC